MENKNERKKIRIKQGIDSTQKKGGVFSKFYNFLYPPLDLCLIRADSQNWQQIVIEQLYIADAVIFHLTPKNFF